MNLEDLIKHPTQATKNVDIEQIYTSNGANESEIQMIEAEKYPDETGIAEYDGLLKVEDETQQPEEPIYPNYLLFDPEIVGYPDDEMQDEIYTWVSRKIKSLNTIDVKKTIKDFGCGRGDFNTYFDPLDYSYVGYELKESLCNVGRFKYTGINIRNQNFLYIDPHVEKSDYTVVIGTLNESTGVEKWPFFSSVLNCALQSTTEAVIFVLSSNMDGIDGFYDYPFVELFEHFPEDLRFEIDYNKFKDIYMLTVHIGGYN